MWKRETDSTLADAYETPILRGEPLHVACSDIRPCLFVWQSANIGRNVVLNSNLPLSVPGTAVDRQCGSSQQAIHFAAQAVMSGTQDIVIAGGVETMSTVPLGANIGKGELDQPNSSIVQDRFGPSGFYSQFVGAELVASKYDITRLDMDTFAAASHAKAAAAIAAGKFDDEIVTVEGRDKEGNVVEHRVDEGVRPGTTVEKLGTLDTLEDGALRSFFLEDRLCASAMGIFNFLIRCANVI